MLEELWASSEYRQDVYHSACVRRDIHQLRQLFERYPEDNFIAHTDQKGDLGVLFAATEENGLETLKWLQSRGGAVDQANHYGRTPLMEASLWGRLEIVQYLTSQQVNIEARDGNGMTALELAADLTRNVDERRLRASIVYRESGDASTQRRSIQAHLERLSFP